MSSEIEELKFRIKELQSKIPRHDMSQGKNCIDCAFFDMPPSYAQYGLCKFHKEKYWVWAKGCRFHKTRKEIQEILESIKSKYPKCWECESARKVNDNTAFCQLPIIKYETISEVSIRCPKDIIVFDALSLKEMGGKNHEEKN